MQASSNGETAKTTVHSNSDQTLLSLNSTIADGKLINVRNANIKACFPKNPEPEAVLWTISFGCLLSINWPFQINKVKENVECGSKRYQQAAVGLQLLPVPQVNRNKWPDAERSWVLLWTLPWPDWSDYPRARPGACSPPAVLVPHSWSHGTTRGQSRLLGRLGNLQQAVMQLC